MDLDIGRIGVWSPSSTWEAAAGSELGDAARELEELGYGAVWLGSSRGDLELPRKLLSATQRLVVTTAIVSVWTNPAADVAANYRLLAAHHPDRLLLGLGSSHAPLVERQAGVRYERPLTRLAEYLDELDELDPTIPIDRRVLAALGPRALALAASRSAGPHPYLVTPEYTRMARETIGPGPLLAPEQKVVLESDPTTARAIARATMKDYLELPNYTNNFLRLGFTTEDLERGGSDRLIDEVVAWGDTGAVLGRIAEHHENGADHVSVQVLTSTGPRHSQPLPRAHWRLLAEAFQATAPR